MNSKVLYYLLICIFQLSVFAQEKGPDITGQMKMYYAPSISSQIANGTFKAYKYDGKLKKANPKHRHTNKVVPGKGLPKSNDALVDQQKDVYKTKGKAPQLVFDAATATYIPSDPTGAVGPNHYVGGWNSGFRIFDKSGNPLIPEASLGTLFSGNVDGDPVVLYDAAADRFIITEFFGFTSGPPYGFNIAISQGPDPVNSGWHIYSFNTSNFPDYPKYSIWPDGYYITTNISGTNKVFVMERNQMLNGAAAQFLAFPLTGLATGGFYSPQVFSVCDANMPASGNATLVFMQDDTWSGITTDHLKLWNINVDWNNTANSTISAPTQLSTTPFISVFDGGSFSNLSQPSGPDIDALQATIMNQAQFRKFATHNSAVFNFVVDTDATSNELAGIRWYELRQSADGQAWSIYQEGTYISPAGNKHAFNGSMAMDDEGNIGMGYSTVSTGENIGIYYTGRYANDPLNTMTVYETLIAQSTSYNPYTRYADYSHLTVDPADNKTFWYISEYFKPSRKDVVGVFELASVYNNDVGVVQINTPIGDGILGMEIIGVTLKNFGNNPQSGFQVNYQVNGSAAVSETFTPNIGSGLTSPFVFSVPFDMGMPGQSYTITASTQLTSDQDTSNDATIKTVTHLYPDDIGISAITAPVSGNTLCMEPITVSIENFGANPQTNFHVSYVLDGNPPIMELINTTLNSGSSMSYTFGAMGDFCAFGDHNLSVSTNLGIDNDPMNDTMQTSITNIPCTNNVNNTAQTIGPGLHSITSVIPIAFSEVITDINVKLNLYHSKDDDLDIYLISPNGTYIELTTDNGGTGHDYVNTYFDDDAAQSITTGTAPFTGSYQPEGNLADLNGLNSIGNWTLEITDDTTNGHGGTLVSWELDLCFDPDIGIYDNLIDAHNLIVSSDDQQHFHIILEDTVFEEDLIINVFDIYGQKVVENMVSKMDGSYHYDLDMSYAASGVYLIKLGDTSGLGYVKRIIIK